MSNNRWKTALTVLVPVLSVLSSAIGYGFMGGANVSFAVKFTCGFILIVTPVFVVHLLILLWKKSK